MSQTGTDINIGLGADRLRGHCAAGGRMWAELLTDCADQAVVLPALAAGAAGLWLGGWRRGGLALACGVGATLAAMGLLKLLAAACHGLPMLPGVLSPSGHAASAAAFGAVAALLRRRPSVRFAVAAALVLGGLIGWSRLALGAHTPSEVVVGLVVGVTGAAATVWLAGPPPARRRRLWAALGLAAVLAAMHGRHLDAETGFRTAGGWMADRCWVQGSAS